ncbi:hypothetical protein FXO38_35524 [Capsicum annuum]|nr:hypothetical protein FXO38_35524 [Capsicum annuum]
MSKPNVRRYNEIEKHKREKEPISNNYKSNLFYLSKHLKKVYPIELTHKTYSLPSSLSRLSSSLSHTLNDSSPLDQKKSEVSASNMVVLQVNPSPSEKELMRCSWLTSSSDKAYVKFHDECWGVPVYDDQEGFVGFNAKQVAKMGEKEINELIGKEFGSFSCYMWNHMNYKPIINKFRNARNVPLRSPKAESISKDLVKRGFRHVGPVIVNSFMQAAGMTIDHLIYCFRHKECVDLAETPWRHF